MPSRPLRSQMLALFLPALAIPLALAGLLGSLTISRRTFKEAQLRLTQQAVMGAQAIDLVIFEKFRLLDTLAASPTVQTAVRQGAQQAQTNDLSGRSQSQLETQFAASRRLSPNPQLDTYLQHVAEVGDFSELIVTERNGFNIAYSQITSDFVQRDEPWWQQARQDRRWVGEPGVDRSTDTFSLELSYAILDPRSQTFLGVIKAGVAVRSVGFLSRTLPNFGLTPSAVLQLIEVDTEGTVMAALSGQTAADETLKTEILGGQALLVQASNLVTTANSIRDRIASVAFEQDGRLYSLAKVPVSNWVVAVSVDLTEIRETMRDLTLALLVIAVVLGGGAIAAILRYSKSLSAPLKTLANASERVADGDLTTQVTTQGSAEVTVLGRSFNEMVAAMKEAQTSQQLWQDRAVQLLERLDTLNDSIETVSQRARAAETQVLRANELVEAGEAAMTRTMKRMGHIQDSVEEAAACMMQLNQGAQRIAQAASLVRALAERTNLVALNASVSAARTAGESREFGVVAKEIRSLSQQSEQIVREIDRLVGNIQQYTQQVTIALQQGKTEANTGFRLLSSNQSDLREITSATGEIVAFTREIARLTQSQVSTATFLSQAIAELKHR